MTYIWIAFSENLLVNSFWTEWPKGETTVSPKVNSTLYSNYQYVFTSLVNNLFISLWDQSFSSYWNFQVQRYYQRADSFLHVTSIMLSSSEYMYLHFCKCTKLPQKWHVPLWSTEFEFSSIWKCWAYLDKSTHEKCEMWMIDMWVTVL